MRGLHVIRHVFALLSTLFFITSLGLIFWAGVAVAVTGWTPTVVMSGSMEPAIKVGYILLADPMSEDELRSVVKQGHVLLAEDPAKPGTLVTHRVMQYDEIEDSYITRGDANPKNDSTPVPIANVKGLERLAVPYIGLPYQAAKTGNYIPLLVFLIVLLIAGFMMKQEWKIVTDEEKALQPDTDAITSRRAMKKRKRQEILASTLSFLLTLAIVAGGVLVVGTSFAAFSGATKNAANKFTAKSSFAPPPAGCWTSTQTEGYINATFYQTGYYGWDPSEWTAPLWVKINSTNNGYFYSMDTSNAVDTSTTQGLTFSHIATSSIGTERTITSLFDHTGYVSGTIGSMNMNNMPVDVKLKIYDQVTSTRQDQYWEANLKIQRC